MATSLFLSEALYRRYEMPLDILQACRKDVKEIIDANWEAVTYLAEELHKREELDYDEDTIATLSEKGVTN